MLMRKLKFMQILKRNISIIFVYYIVTFLFFNNIMYDVCENHLSFHLINYLMFLLYL